MYFLSAVKAASLLLQSQSVGFCHLRGWNLVVSVPKW